MAKDLTGKTFTRLTVVSLAKPKVLSSGRKLKAWNCICKDGVRLVVYHQYLVNGHTKSCGCLKRDLAGTHSITHGMSREGDDKHPFYRAWSKIHNRCKGKSAWDFKYYKSRNIRVCRRWRKFENFRDDMFSTWKPGLTLDRINNNGNYSPSNCRWATRIQQMNNTSTNHIVRVGGVKMTVSQLARKLKMNAKTVFNRIYDGWTIKEIVNTPTRKRCSTRTYDAGTV